MAPMSLRKTYKKRLTIALLCTAAVAVIGSGWFFSCKYTEQECRKSGGQGVDSNRVKTGRRKKA